MAQSGYYPSFLPRDCLGVITDVFLLRLGASFAAGFGVVAAVTAIADISGEGPAGFIGGLPWTGPVSLLALGFTQSNLAAIRAVALFPLGVVSTMSFLLFYAVPKDMRYWERTALALVLWGLISTAIVLFAPDSITFATSAALPILAVLLYARSRIRVGGHASVSTRPGWKRSFQRGMIGGLVVSFVVILGEIVGPIAGGVFAAAPATWFSSLYVTSRSQGLDFSRSLTLTFMKVGALTSIPFAVAASFFLGSFGVWLGTLLAYAAISPLAYLAWRVARVKPQVAH